MHMSALLDGSGVTPGSLSGAEAERPPSVTNGLDQNAERLANKQKGSNPMSKLVAFLNEMSLEGQKRL